MNSRDIVSPQPIANPWAIDSNEAIIEFTQTFLGKFILVMLCAMLLALSPYSEKWTRATEVVSVAALYAYLPKYRNWIIFIAAIGALFAKPLWQLWVTFSDPGFFTQHGQLDSGHAQLLRIAALVAYFGGVWLVLLLANRYSSSMVIRRPVISLLAGSALLFTLSCSPLLQGAAHDFVWAIFTIYCAYIWFFVYAIIDQRSRHRSPHLFQIGIFHPFWGSTGVPFGKGAAYLRKMESRTPRDLAVTQIKGFKLLVWASVLTMGKLGAESIIRQLQIPLSDATQAAYHTHHAFGIITSWQSLILDTALAAVKLAIMGGLIIALARLAGFRLLRNTYRPLEARTLVEFWNRYYYYFKELMVEFFFLPTFMRVFQNHPRMRMFFATFMAAGVGNALYHFLRDVSLISTMGLMGYVVSFTSYLFYCTVLAIGIGVSQARLNAGIRPSSTLTGKLQSFVCIWSFFVCLFVFGNESMAYSLGERLSFMFSLFGVNL